MQSIGSGDDRRGGPRGRDHSRARSPAWVLSIGDVPGGDEVRVALSAHTTGWIATEHAGQLVGDPALRLR